MGTMRRTPPGQTDCAIAYLRVSTDEQHLGPEAQRASIEGWGRLRGVSVLSWHIDAGVSGASELQDRPGLLRALDDLVALKAGVLVVARRDRLARDVVVAATIERAARRKGAVVSSADGVGNGDAPADRFMRTILDGAAAYELELIRARTRAALQAKKARGERAGTVPFGFRALEGGKLQYAEPEQSVIDRVCELRREGFSLRGIVTTLEGEGTTARTGQPLQLTQVARIVHKHPERVRPRPPTPTAHPGAEEERT